MKPTLTPRRPTVSNGSTGVPLTTAANAAGKEASTSTSTTTAAPVSKWTVCYTAIFQGKDKPAPYRKDDPERFYSDLFCLRLDKHKLRTLIQDVPDSHLLESGTIKNNVRELFFYAVKSLRAADSEDPRLVNVLETLHIVLRDILGRSLPNYSSDIMSLLAGSSEQADAIFPDFVTAVEGVIQNPDVPVRTKERALNLALLIVASIEQGALNSYFLRRDLFGTVTKLVTEPTTSQLGKDGLILLGLLANFHKYEARNSLLIRFEDLVDETVMKCLRDMASTSIQSARDAFVARQDDSPPTIISNVTSLVSSLRFFGGPPAAAPAKAKPTSTSNGARDESIWHDLPPTTLTILLPIYDLINSNKAFCSFLLHDRPDIASPDPDFLTHIISLSTYAGVHAASSERSQRYSRLIFIILALLVEDGGHTFYSNEQAGSIRICRQRHPSLPPAADDAKRPLICGILDSLSLFVRFNIVRKRLDVETYLLVLRMLHKILHQLKTMRLKLAYDWLPLVQGVLSLAHFLVSRQAELADLEKMEDLIDQVLITLDFMIVWSDTLLPNVDKVAQLFYEILRADDTLTKLGNLTISGGRSSSWNGNQSTATTPPATASATMPTTTMATTQAVTVSSPRVGGASPGPLSPSGGPVSGGATSHSASSSQPSSLMINGKMNKSSSGLSTPKSPGGGAGPFSPFLHQHPPEPTGPASQSVKNLNVVKSHFGGRLEDFKEKNGGSGVVLESYQILNIIKSSMEGLDLRESMALESGGISKYSESEHQEYFVEFVHIAMTDVLSSLKTPVL